MLEIKSRYIFLFILLLFFTFNSSFFAWCMPILIPQIISDFRLTYIQAVLLLSTTSIMWFLMPIPTGMLIDLKGTRLLLSVGAILIGVFSFMRGFADSFITLFVFQACLGAGASIIWTSMPRTISTWFPKEKVSLASGVYSTGSPIGLFFTLNLTTYLTRLNIEWNQIFFLYGLWGLIFTVLWLSIKNPSKLENNKQQKIFQNSLSIIKKKQVWLLTFMYACVTAVMIGSISWLPYLLQLRGFSLASAGLATSFIAIGFAVGAFSYGLISKRIGLQKTIILYSGVIAGPTFFSLTNFTGIFLWFSLFLIGFLSWGILTIILIITAKLPGLDDKMGSVTGVIVSFGNLGSALIPTIIGYILEVTKNYFLPILLLAILVMLPSIICLSLKETGNYISRL